MTPKQKQLFRLMYAGNSLVHPDTRAAAERLTADEIEQVGHRLLAHRYRAFKRQAAEPKRKALNH